MKKVLNRLGFHNLLFWLFLYLIVNPFLLGFPYFKYVVQLLLSFVLIFSLFVIYHKKGLYPITMGLLVLTLVVHWIGVLGLATLSQPISYGLIIIYLGMLIYSFFSFIINSKQVTLRLISATLCLYLIIGIFWGTIYALLESLVPGSFSGSLLEQANSSDYVLQTFTYLSFVTLTTLGYGDITPMTLGAGGLCQTEAIVGQFYIAILVAFLVGMYSAEKGASKQAAQKDSELL